MIQLLNRIYISGAAATELLAGKEDVAGIMTYVNTQTRTDDVDDGFGLPI